MNRYLNPKEHDVLSTILHAENPINVPQIAKLHPELTANVIQPAIRKLIKLNLIEVAEITVNRNNFSRCFRPTSSATEIIQKMFASEYMSFRRLISKQAISNAILQIDEDPEKIKKEISKIEHLLQEYKDTNNSKGKKEI